MVSLVAYTKVIASVCNIFVFWFSWTVALWGVYGLKSPIIVFVMFMGFVMTIAIIPGWSQEKPPPKKTK